MPIKLPKNRQRGIGLVEVILVVAIAGFMIVLAINGVANSGRAQFDDGMRQVLNYFRQVQNEASSGQAPAQNLAGKELVGKGIVFEGEAPTVAYTNYWLVRSGEGAADRNVIQKSDINGVKVNLPAGIKITGFQTLAGSGTKGTLNFVNLTGSTSALPYFFASSDFVGDVANADKYTASQTGVVVISFEGSKADYKATIEVNTATGAMELKQ